MSTQNVPVYNQYLGNGVATQFSIGFPYLNRDYVKVYLLRKDGAQELLDSTRYTFVNDKVIEFPKLPTDSVLNDGDVLTIQRETPLGGDYEFDNQKRLFPVEVMNADDLSFQQIQELAREIKRAVKTLPTDTITGDDLLLEFNQKVVEAKEAAVNSENSATASASSASESQSQANRAQGIVDAFDTNAAQKTQEYNTNAQQKLDAYNSNDISKTQAFNTNAAQKQAQIDASAEEARKWAVGTISEQPQGSAKHWAEEAEKSASVVKTGSFGNIGDIKYTTRTDVPNGGAWCDGAEYTQAMFPDVYQMLVDGKLQSTTVSEFDSSVSANGSCGMFALNSETTSFKVPLLKDVYVKAGDAPSMFGAESLPKPTLNYGLRKDTTTSGYKPEVYGHDGYTTGWSNSSETDEYMQLMSNNLRTSAMFVEINTSSTYQNGAKVNPDHVVYRAYIVLYTSAAEASVAQAQEFMTALGGKANVGLDNVSPAQSFKDMSVGWGIPDYSAGIDINATSYTAPTDGIVLINCVHADHGKNNAYINGVQVYDFGMTGSYANGTMTPFETPVSAGDVITSNRNILKFYPLKGVN